MIKVYLVLIICIFFIFLLSDFVLAALDYVEEQKPENEGIREKQKSWTRDIWQRIWQKITSYTKNWVKRRVEWIKEHTLTPLKNKIGEGSDILEEEVGDIKNLFIGLLKKFGILQGNKAE